MQTSLSHIPLDFRTKDGKMAVPRPLGLLRVAVEARPPKHLHHAVGRVEYLFETACCGSVVIARIVNAAELGRCNGESCDRCGSEDEFYEAQYSTTP